MIRVLLIQPHVEDYYLTGIRTYPLGLAYVAAAISDLCEVSLLDCCTGFRGLPLPASPFSDLDPYYRTELVSPFSLFGHYTRFGMSDEEISEELKSFNPHVVGISSLFSAYHRQAERIAELVKENLPDSLTVMGGLHPTLFPENVLESPAVDFVIRGEGEFAFRDLIGHVGKGFRNDGYSIEGLCFKKSDGTLSISEPVELSTIDHLPDRSVLATDRYKMFKKPYAFILSSRGCPRMCSFCGRPPTRFRKRSLESFNRELSDCAERGITILDFEDDMFNEDRTFFFEKLALLEKYNFECFAMNGLYPVNLDPIGLEKLQRAGFRKLNVSLVDLHPETLRAQHRRSMFEDLDSLWRNAGSVDLLCEFHFIIGLPGQTVNDIVDIMISIMECQALLGPSIYYPVPNSRYWTKSITDFARCRSSLINPCFFERDDTVTLMKLSRFINFCKRIVDRENISLTLSDLMSNGKLFPSETQWMIFRELVSTHRFVGFERGRQRFVPELARPDIIHRFFSRCEGLSLRGFKTSGTMKFDFSDTPGYDEKVTDFIA